MFRWFVCLALACSTSVFAAPASPEAEAPPPAPWTAQVRGQLAGLGQSVASQAHDVADHATDLVAAATGFLGVPYRRGGSSAETGFDCSGFVRTIFQQTRGLLLPRRAVEQAASTEKIDQRELLPGDLVFFNTMHRAFSHVGIYVGDGKFIHSPRSGSRVRVEDMRDSYWSKRFNGARRVIDEFGLAVAGQTAAPAIR